MTCIDISCASCMLYKVGKKTDAFHTHANCSWELVAGIATGCYNKSVACNLSTGLLQLVLTSRNTSANDKFQQP